jgi:hypothetical protein
MAETETSPIAAKCARRLPHMVLLAALTGCAAHDDPFQRPGTWRLTYDNDANIAAMAVDKRQLVVGVGDPASPGVLSEQAVHRLLTDHVKPLPSTEIGPVSGATQSGAGGQ